MVSLASLLLGRNKKENNFTRIDNADSTRSLAQSLFGVATNLNARVPINAPTDTRVDLNAPQTTLTRTFAPVYTDSRVFAPTTQITVDSPNANVTSKKEATAAPEISSEPRIVAQPSQAFEVPVTASPQITPSIDLGGAASSLLPIALFGGAAYLGYEFLIKKKGK